MEDLYKAVTKGVYPRIPTTYSSELTDILRMMLQVDPLVRPSTDKLLNSSILKKRLKETPTLEDLSIDRDIKDENP
jgi:NIMA (never in mitosis gene a)-related kinase